MKVFIALAGVIVLFSAWLPALAQGRGGGHGGGGARPAPQQVPVHAAGLQNAGPRGTGGMTREERQQLKRDVNDHGKEIYGGRGGGSRR